MIDFDKIISSARSEGTSFTDLAKSFTDALNKASKTETEAEAKYERDSLIDEVEASFDKNYLAGRCDLFDVATLAWLYIVDNTELGKAMTSRDELTELLDFITEDVKLLMDRWKVHQAIFSVFSGFDNKSKDKKDQNEKKVAGKENRDSGKKFQNDRDKIEDFLRNWLM